tara:strand:+ start:2696 stop:3601 length:906 start_codon:yes stop_codon:yes gene_type:complete
MEELMKRTPKEKEEDLNNKRELKVPVVRKVQDPPNVKTKPLHPHLPQTGGPGGGALVLLVAPVKSGKSTLISNIMLNPDFYGENYFDYCKVMSNTIMNDVTSRFMLKAFDVTDHYDEAELNGLIDLQASYEKEDQPEIAYICDDLLGSIPRNSVLNHLCARFRHYNFKLFIISTQNFKAVSTITRQNATNIIIGSPYPNQSELMKISESYGELVGGSQPFLDLYKTATPEKYDFLHMDLQENPVHCYRNFEELLMVGDKWVVGDHDNYDIVDMDNSDTEEEENIDEDINLKKNKKKNKKEI